MTSNLPNRYFPYTSPRPGQLRLIRAIQEDVAVGKHLCVEAANGFGKTIAALSGVLPLLEKEKFGIIYIARTHKQLDRVMQELRRVSEPTRFSGVVQRGRASSCLNPIIQKYAASARLASFICNQLKQTERCEFYTNLLKKMKRNPDYCKRFYLNPLTGLELRQKCKTERVCPYELTRQLLPLVTVVATSYNQVFDPYINSIFFDAFNRPLAKTILLIDEAHNLPRIAVELASARLNLTSIQQAAKEAKKFGLRSIAIFCIELEKAIELLLKESTEQEVRFDPIEFGQRISKLKKTNECKSFTSKLLKEGDKILYKLLAEGRPPISYIHYVARFFVQWCHFLERQDAAYFLIRNGINQSSIQLEVIALDPRYASASILNSSHASVHLSGTLQPLNAHIELVGLPEDTQTLTLPSPFSPTQIFPVISLGVTTAMRQRTPHMYEKITKRILEAVQATPHNIGIFVPSYRVLKSLLQTGLDSRIDRELFIEKQGLKSSDNDRLIKAFKNKADEGAALLGVLGGRNCEGEDYPGHEMETVVVVGVPYAIPSPREKARIEYFDLQYHQKGRLYGYQLPAMRTAAQAAGRPIRRLEDRGALVFLDNRYATPYCSRLLPRWILENLKRADDSDGILYKQLKSFYEPK
ncbi:MAG: helicase C-terminal domain-containing protein [Candidatus Thorarchaeota archaeon]